MAYILKETVRGIMAVAIEDELMSSRRELFFTGPCDAQSCNTLLKELMYLEHESNEEIKLYINSPGGEVSSGLAVYDYIMTMESPLSTYVTGTAASMGSILFLAGTKDRLMYPHSKVMVHAPSYGGNHSIGGKKPDEVQAELDELNAVRRITDGIIARRTGKTLEEIREISRKDTYFTAEEAVAFGLATGIVPTRKENCAYES